MSKYFIISKNDFAGISGNDSGNLNQYTELGWELAIFRIYFNELVRKKIFNLDSDFVVTNHDRAFLYTKYCKNVISYNDYLNYRMSSDSILDIGYESRGYEPYIINEIFAKEMVQYTDEVKNNIYNTMLDLPEIDNVLRNKNKFIAICIRKRDWGAERTPDEIKINKIIELYIKNGFSIYVMGKSCESYDNGKNIFHVTLPELASLLNSDLCEEFISPVSGGGMIRFYTGKCNFTVIDQTNIVKNHVLLFGGDVNRTNTLTDKNFKIVKSEDEIIDGLLNR